MSYAYEALADEISALPPEVQIERMLALFERIHPGVRVALARSRRGVRWRAADPRLRAIA